MARREMNDREKYAALCVLIALAGVLILAFICKADTYSDTMISFFAKRIDSLEKTIEVMREEQYRQGMEFAEMRGEMRGRQNATTATAAGVPTGLAGLLAWWMRREKRKK